MLKNRKVLLDYRSFFFFLYILFFIYGLIHLSILFIGDYNKLYMISSSVGLIIAGIALFLDVIYWLYTCKTMKKWTSSTAEIIQCELINMIDPVHSLIDPIEEFYDIKINYKYSFNGKEYISYVYSPIPRNMLFFDKDITQNNFDKIKNNKKIQVYVNSNSPKKSAVIIECNQMRINEFYAYVFLSILFIILGGLSLI